MKVTLWALISLSIFYQPLKAQVVPLFSIAYDSTCLPYTPIGNDFITNDALSYSWNFGNGTIINQKNPNYTYTQAGNFKLSLTITTNTADKMVNALTITEIPNTWKDGTDAKPDLYFILKDSSGNILFTSNSIMNTSPPITFKTNFLIKSGKNYTIEIWDYDDVGSNDLVAYIPITNTTMTNTFSNSGATAIIATLTNNTSYTYSKDVRFYNQPTVSITASNSLLSAKITGGIGGTYAYRWRLDSNIVADSKTYKPILNGNYTVAVTAANCNATSSVFAITRVGSEDLTVLKDVHIYPTPSVLNEKKWLSMSSDEAKTIEIVLSDVLGQPISRQYLSIKMGENIFELPKINATGLYFIRLLEEHKTIFLGKTLLYN